MHAILFHFWCSQHSLLLFLLKQEVVDGRCPFHREPVNDFNVLYLKEEDNPKYFDTSAAYDGLKCNGCNIGITGCTKTFNSAPAGTLVRAQAGMGKMVRVCLSITQGCTMCLCPACLLDHDAKNPRSKESVSSRRSASKTLVIAAV